MPGQPFHGLLSEKQTTNMLKVAARPPAENARRIVGRGQDIMGIEPQNPGLVSISSSQPRECLA